MENPDISFSGFEIPFSYSNTCGMGLDVFGKCDCGGRHSNSKRYMIEQLPTPAEIPIPYPPEKIVKVKKALKSQSKPLMFINQDAKHLKPQATRSEITSHLRKAYQPWKHRMEACSRREASKPIENKKASKVSTEKQQDLLHSDFTFGEPTHASQSDKFSQIIETRHLRSDVLCQTPPPPPLLYHGNSDPFSSLAFPITPLIATLIKFEHAHLHPCIYSTRNAPSRAYGTSYLADMHGPATSQAAVYGYLSRAAIVLSSATSDPRFAQAALVLKGRSSALLRAQLASGGEKGSGGDILRKILALMIAELFAHNYAAALVHSKILLKLLKEQSETDEEFDMRFCFSVIYSEIQRSCMSLTSPCFDVSATGWVSRTFESVGSDAYIALISTLNIDASPLEPQVLGLELAEIFGEVRTVRAVSQAYSASPLYGTPTPLALYLPARVVLCLGKLVRYYTEHCQGRPFSSLSPRQLIHRAAVLGALYWVRKAGHIDSIKVSSTSTIYSAGPMILARLKESLGWFDEVASEEEGELYRDLRFWVLYIGAQEEQGKIGLGESVERWFTNRLVSASARIGVFTWGQAGRVLERYPHPDAAEPHGSTWFAGMFSHSDVSTGSTCLGGTFDRSGSGKKELLGTKYGAGDNHMTWTTDNPLPSSSIVDSDPTTTCAILAHSIQPARTGTFACPTWDIGQDDYWISTQSKITDLPWRVVKKEEQQQFRHTPRMNDPKMSGVETGPVAFAMYPEREMDEREALAEARRPPVSWRGTPESAAPNMRKEKEEQDVDWKDFAWDQIRKGDVEQCVMIAETWEHGVNCSWGTKCPLSQEERG